MTAKDYPPPWIPETLPGKNLVSLYTEGWIQQWFWLVEEGKDLTLEEYEDAELWGDSPEWLEHELDAIGWDMFDMGGYGGDHGVGRLAGWALEEGIAPYQPFLIQLDKPEYYSCGMYGEEVDVHYPWEIVEIVSITPYDAARRWEHYMMERRREINALKQFAAWRDHQFRTRINDMYCTVQTYGFCDGIRYHLNCRFHTEDYGHLWSGWLASGESDRCDHAEAKARFVADIKAKLPHLTDENIDDILKKRRYY